MIDVVVVVASVAACLVVVVLFIILLWYLVYELFLKDFKFVQEMVGKNE